MQGIEELKAVNPQHDTVLAVGVFDGVHRGHRHLLEQVRREARSRGCLPGVVTFRNHPRTVLFPEAPVPLLIDPEERFARLREEGVDLVVPLTFTTELSQVRAREFCRLLKRELRMQGLIVGPSFALGHRREGTPEVLRQLGEEIGFTVHEVQPLTDEEERVSSTAVRRALDVGDVARANRYLGYPFVLAGRVVHGEGRGRQLGYPTINLEVPGGMAVPTDGVYATWAHIDGSGRWKAATNIGVRPTFGASERVVEAFLIGYEGDLYNRTVRLEFAERLRDEERFDSVDALVAQMYQDVMHAERVLTGE